MPERSDDDQDRRRSPRFNCGGQAEIVWLPSSGIIVPGAIRDLSLHGCCVDTPQPMDCGARAEILVRVNAASFRALGTVKALRGRSGAGLEFVQLSAGGKEMLADLIMDLGRLQALMNRLKSERREMDAASFRKELQEGRLQAALLSERFPFLRTILPAENAEEKSEPTATASKNPTATAQPLVVTVDLFG